MEKKKIKHKEMLTELRKSASMMRGRGRGALGGGGGYRFFGNSGNYNTGSSNDFSASDDGGEGYGGMHPSEIRRQETLDRARMEQMRKRGMVSYSLFLIKCDGGGAVCS